MSRIPLLRPTLLPGLIRVWRTPHTLQLGLDPVLAVLVDLPDPRAAQLLDLLDGSRPERMILTRGVALGVAVDDTRALLDGLHAAGLIVGAHAMLPAALPDDARQRLTAEAAALGLSAARPDGATPPDSDTRPGNNHRPGSPAQILRARGRARVVVTGHGRLAAALSVALAESGVGHVHPDLPGRVTRQETPGGPLRAGDTGRARGEAIAAAVRQAAPGTLTRPVRGAASLVVQLGHDQPVALLAARYAHRRQAHLAVTIREGAAVIGPFVPATGGPCLNCVDLHRRDRDAQWPTVAAAQATARHEPCSVATVLAATGFAVAEALTFLDGGIPQTIGGAVEIRAAGRFRRRTWPAHAVCGCGRRRSRAPR